MSTAGGEYKIIGRGWCGWHADSDTCSLTGGTLDWYLEETEEGALVYDASEADEDAFARLITRGPMVKCSLEPGQAMRFNARLWKSAQNMLLGLGGAFHTVTKRALAEDPEAQEYGSLDYVSLDVYEGLLRKVPGMKIGRVLGGKVQWEVPE